MICKTSCGLFIHRSINIQMSIFFDYSLDNEPYYNQYFRLYTFLYSLVNQQESDIKQYKYKET